MIQNLSLRHVYLHTFTDYPDLESQRKRYKDAGFETVTAYSMNTYWDTHLQESEKERVAKLEFLDEVEEWRLFGDHYCILYAFKGIPIEGDV